MEGLMLADPGHWQKHCSGTPDEMRVQSHFSYRASTEAAAGVGPIRQFAECRIL